MQLLPAGPCRPPPPRPPGGPAHPSGSGRRTPARWAEDVRRGESTAGGSLSNSRPETPGFVHSEGLYLHFALVGGLDVEVEQEVRTRESGTIRPQLSAARRIRLRVDPAASQVVVWDLWRTMVEEQSSMWPMRVCVRACMHGHVHVQFACCADLR